MQPHTTRTDRISKLSVIIWLCIIVFASVLPLVYSRYTIGDAWRGVMVNYVGDALHYFQRIRSSSFGSVFGHNPYYFEHGGDIAPFVSVADALVALPMRFGVSLNTTIIANAIFWNLLFVWLLYLLLKKLELKPTIALWLTIPIYLQVYGIMVRPVSSQAILPFILLFYLALISWLKDARRRNSAWLVFSLAIPFYIYPYLWQICLATTLFVFMWLFLKKKTDEVKSLFVIIACALILAIPAFVYMYQDYSHLLFLETINRVGYVASHFPSIEAIDVIRWLITGLGLGFLIRFFSAHARSDKNFNLILTFFVLTGLGIFAALLSNIITGKDFDIGNHARRFVILWLPIVLMTLVYYLVRKANFNSLSFYKKSLITILIGVNLFVMVKQLPRSIVPPFTTMNRQEARYVQSYAEPIAWLEAREREPQVVWANGSISNYITTLSKHFVLFSGVLNSQIYFMPSSELEERYLVSRYFQNLNRERITEEYGWVAGASINYVTRNIESKMRVCNIVPFLKQAEFCDNQEKIVSMQSEKEANITRLLEKNKQEIRPNLISLLQKYNVSYIMKDLERDTNFDIQKIKGARAVYNDGHFSIYTFK